MGDSDAMWSCTEWDVHPSNTTAARTSPSDRHATTERARGVTASPVRAATHAHPSAPPARMINGSPRA